MYQDFDEPNLPLVLKQEHRLFSLNRPKIALNGKESIQARKVETQPRLTYPQR